MSLNKIRELTERLTIVELSRLFNESLFKILVVDDDIANSNLIIEALHSYDFRPVEIVPSATGEDALLKFNSTTLNLVILDIKLPGLSGLDVLREIRRTNNKLPIIMVSSFPIEYFQQAIDAGANAFIEKSLDLSLFRQKIIDMVIFWAGVVYEPK